MPAVHRIVLVPGFFGFANLGDVRYFGHVRDHLQAICPTLGIDPQITVVATYPTSSLRRRAVRVLEAIASAGGDGPLHLVGHSSGGLDVRLVATPSVTLPTDLDVPRLTAPLASIVTVATPHYGTPLAGFFTSLLGQQLLRLLSILTIHVLRFGRVPISAVLRLGAMFARVDRHLGINSALLDQLFDQLLGDFSTERRLALETFFSEVAVDRDLMPQLTPEGMDVFNASAVDRPGVRGASVVSMGRKPGLGSAITAGLDPTAQATHLLYLALHRLTAGAMGAHLPSLTSAQSARLSAAFGELPESGANDGVVPTLSQVWGEVIHATLGDHLDVIGHFNGPTLDPPHFDWLVSGSAFDRTRFDALWTTVARWIAGAPLSS